MKEEKDWRIISGEPYYEQWSTFSEEEKLRKFFLTETKAPDTIWVKLGMTKKGHFQITEMRKRIYFSYNKRGFYTRCSFKSVVVTPHTIRGDREVLNHYLITEDYTLKLRGKSPSPESIYHFLKTGEAIEVIKPRTPLERYYNVSFQKWENLAREAHEVAKRCYFLNKPFNPEWSKTRIRDEYTRTRREVAREESLLYPDTRLNPDAPLRPIIGPFIILNSERDLKYWASIMSNCSYSYKYYIKSKECLLFIYYDKKSNEDVMGEVRILNDRVEIVQYMGKCNKYVAMSPEFNEAFKLYSPWFKGYLKQKELIPF